MSPLESGKAVFFIVHTNALSTPAFIKEAMDDGKP